MHFVLVEKRNTHTMKLSPEILPQQRWVYLLTNLMYMTVKEKDGRGVISAYVLFSGQKVTLQRSVRAVHSPPTNHTARHFFSVETMGVDFKLHSFP